jgi:hypothetical protein
MLKFNTTKFIEQNPTCTQKLDNGDRCGKPTVTALFFSNAVCYSCAKSWGLVRQPSYSLR